MGGRSNIFNGMKSLKTFTYYSSENPCPSVTDPVESISPPGVGENVTELFGFHCIFVVFFFSLLVCASPINLAKTRGKSNILNGMKSLKTFY